MVHVHDASRSVGVVGDLLARGQRQAHPRRGRSRARKAARSPLAIQHAKALKGLEAARQNATPIEWKASDINEPPFVGQRYLEERVPRRTGPLHRLDLLLQHLGAQG